MDHKLDIWHPAYDGFSRARVVGTVSETFMDRVGDRIHFELFWGPASHIVFSALPEDLKGFMTARDGDVYGLMGGSVWPVNITRFVCSSLVTGSWAAHRLWWACDKRGSASLVFELKSDLHADEAHKVSLLLTLNEHDADVIGRNMHALRKAGLVEFQKVIVNEKGAPEAAFFIQEEADRCRRSVAYRTDCVEVDKVKDFESVRWNWYVNNAGGKLVGAFMRSDDAHVYCAALNGALESLGIPWLTGDCKVVPAP